MLERIVERKNWSELVFFVSVINSLSESFDPADDADIFAVVSDKQDHQDTTEGHWAAC